ncbi:hypothetical protein HYPSUDRAFT_618573 [Hypholoma sublateritium FD-334 SS-4]|uniref:F-box domain-containing protein n=1 Tax=Hypholoma sublateritium (strain FD-334 SS-4) TaxID=945553 RepID=A0A0D2PK66_HYPSF|nr:hypothetical protein HYPSUDRAFT_618573 [Hypholoma sublateritium FD-334 SS-4]
MQQMHKYAKSGSTLHWMRFGGMLTIYFDYFRYWPRSEEGYVFERSPRPTDWSRFEKYASHVRWLEYHGPNLNQDAFDEIARTRRQLDIFPNLQTILWGFPFQTNLLCLFMHSGVKKLGLYVMDCPSETLFEEIVDRMPNLTDLDIRSAFTVRIVEDLVTLLLQQLPNLRRIELPHFCYIARIFEVLSRLQLLCTIEFIDRGESQDIEPFKPTIAEGAFLNLHNLSADLKFDDIVAWLQSPSAPSALTYINVTSTLVEMPDSVRRLAFAASKRCQELNRLRLGSALDYAVENFADTGDNGCNITLEILKPLFKLPYLTSFVIDHQYPLLITQQDIESLASSCPAIEILELCIAPAFCMESTLTLEALIPLAQHCTQLKSLGLFVDASRVPEASPEIPPKPFTSLRFLSFGLSIIHDETPTVYLSQLIPPECAINSFHAWENDNSFENIAAQRWQLWSVVGSLVPKLSSIIAQERRRTCALESKVEELRMRAMAPQQD